MRTRHWLIGTLLTAALAAGHTAAEPGDRFTPIAALAPAPSLDTPAPNIRMELRAERTRVDPSIPKSMRPAQSWKKSSVWDAESRQSLGRSGAYWSDPFELRPAAVGAREVNGFAELYDSDWNTVIDNRVRLSLAEDRIVLTTRYGRSRSDTSDAYLSSRPVTNRWRDRALLLDQGDVIGEAFSQRLEVGLWSSGPIRIEGFGSFREVDPFLEWKPTKKKDFFAESGRREFQAGATLRAGPIGLTLSRISGQTSVDDRSQRSYRAVVTTSLEPLRQLAATVPHLGLSRVIPKSAWLSLAEGRIGFDEARAGHAATRDLGFGLSWSGDKSSANLSFWESSYRDARIAYDWQGSGANLDYGLYRKRWALYGGLGAQRERSGQVDYRSLESSYSGYLSLSVRPEAFPALGSTLHVNRYEGEYGLEDYYRSDSWGLRTVLNLSRYLPRIGESSPSLRVSYTIDWSSTADGSSGEHTTLNHGPAISFGMEF